MTAPNNRIHQTRRAVTAGAGEHGKRERRGGMAGMSRPQAAGDSKGLWPLRIRPLQGISLIGLFLVALGYPFPRGTCCLAAAAEPSQNGDSISTFRLSDGQSIAYSGPRGRLILEAGQRVSFACKNDSITINGRPVTIRPFPCPDLYDLSTMRRIFGQVPRVQQLLLDLDTVHDDTTRWRLAVARYSNEAWSVLFRLQGSAPDDSIVGPISHDPGIVNLWNELDSWLCHPGSVVPQGGIVQAQLKGAPVSATESFVICCANVEQLAHRLAAISQSGTPFRLELGSALLLRGSP